MLFFIFFHRLLLQWQHGCPYIEAWYFQAPNIGSAQGLAFGEWSQMMIEEVESHKVDLAPCRNRPPCRWKNHGTWICKLNKTTEGTPTDVVLWAALIQSFASWNIPKLKDATCNQDSSIEIFSCKGSTNACHLLVATSPAFAALCALTGVWRCHA